MGIKSISNKILLLLIICILLCSCDYNTEKSFDIYGKQIVYAECNGSWSAYYLDKNGTLYCPGANIDAGCYVVYQDDTISKVAENVRSYEELPVGGSYITHDNELYMWSLDVHECYGYDQKRKHMKIADNILFADFSQECMIFVDLDNRLYLVGEIGDNVYHMQKPYLLSENIVFAKIYKEQIIFINQKQELFLIGNLMDEEYNVDGPRMIDDHVICADIDGQNLIYLCADGSVNGCLNNNILALDKVLDKGSNQTLSDCTIDIEDDYIFALVDGQLWFYGDYQLFVEGRTREDVSVNEKTDNWHLLSENIIEFSYGQDYIAAINDQNEGLLWGEFFESCSDKDDQVNWLFFENKKVIDDVIHVQTCGNVGISFICADNTVSVFTRDNQAGYGGNSTDCKIVDLNDEPLRWIR